MSYYELANASAEHRPYCPECESENSVKNGKRNGVQSYRCKACGKYFNQKSGSSFQYLKKPDLFVQYAKNFMNHGTIRSDAAKYNIAKNTSMNWRKKSFIAISRLDDAPIQEAEWIDVLHEAIQVKGSQLQQVTKKMTSKNLDQNQVSLVVLSRNNDDCLVLQSQNKLNSEKSALKWTKQELRKMRKKKEPMPTIKKKSKSSGFKIKQVDDYLFRFYDWAKRFRGLSTKYRQCYFNWFRHAVEGTLTSSEMLKLLLNEKAYSIYRQMNATPQVRICWVESQTKTA